MTRATMQLIVDNERVRIMRWDFEAGAATGFHRHEHDYVVVPLTTGTLKSVDSAGVETPFQLTAHLPYFRQAGVEHDVVNPNPHPFSFLEIEIKG
ncbi:MAG: hypothetical protein LOD91_09975 [Limnochordales bacterium]